ncbi:MAG: FecR family protein [Planctomycetota bacterium]
MMRLAILLLMATSVVAQQPAKKTDAETKTAEKKEVKVFEAIVLKVAGKAQSRIDRKAKWQPLKINQVLKPGVVIRTGRKSMVALRVGANATLLIDRQTRIAIPTIIQDGDTLKTRVSLKWGRTEVKVNKVGRVNDFAVSTPSATLAVRGTAFRIMWDAIHGHRAHGVPGNRLRAIEVEYLRKVEAALSSSDTTSERFPLPALDAWYETYIEPLKGAFTPAELEDERLRPIDVANPLDSTGLRAGNQQRGTKQANSPDRQ